MSESLLQNYLTSQHIKVTETTNVKNLQNAVSEVKKQLEKKVVKIIPYALVGLDPKINDNDPVVKEVEAIIIKKWSTFKNNVTATKDKSTTYIRAVILEALNQLAKSNDINAALIWHTTRDIVSHYNLGNENEQIGAFLQNISNKVEQVARKNWGIINQLSSHTFSGGLKIVTPSVASVDINGLTNQLNAAFIHSGWGYGGENPYSQGQNSWQWPKFVAERAAKGISEEINKALIQQSKFLATSTDSIKKGLDEYFNELTPLFEQLSNSFTVSVVANNKRSELLWWKQALYSVRLNQSYRNYQAIESALLMATDLSEMVDPIYPISVDFLLKETLRDIYGDEINTKYKLKDLLGFVLKMKSDIKRIVQSYSDDESGRKPFLNGLANLIKLSNDKEFFADTGINLDSEISISDTAVWFFHGLQASKLSIMK